MKSLLVLWFSVGVLAYATPKPHQVAKHKAPPCELVGENTACDEKAEKP